MQPRLTHPLTALQQKLRDLTARKRQVNKLLVQEKNRLATTSDQEIQKMIGQTIKLFEKQLETIRTQIQELIEADEILALVADVDAGSELEAEALLDDLDMVAIDDEIDSNLMTEINDAFADEFAFILAKDERVAA